MSWHHPLEHRFFQLLKAHGLEGRACILMVSGGVDSMVLAELFRKTVASDLIKVFHFHHGPTTSAQLKFRNQAHKHIARYCKENSLQFISKKSDIELSSEADARKARRSALGEYIKTLSPDDAFKNAFIVWGHQSEDLLETRLLRLIRGVGAQGFKSMAILHGRHFRPLLQTSRNEITQYAKDRAIKFMQDPSNQDPRFLRNWIRNEWLPQLESKRAGSSFRMAESLESVTKAIESSNGTSHQNKNLLPRNFAESRKVPWKSYLILTEHQQSQCLAEAFSHFDEAMWTRNHIDEARKQLARGRNGHMFKVAGFTIQLAQEGFQIDRGIV